MFYLLTMPAEGGNVNLTITEGASLTVSGYDESAKSGWKFIASPVVCDVAAGTVSNIFGATEYDLYRFNQSEDLEWRNYKAQPFELENGKGYLYASKEDATLVFRGTYNTAIEPVEVPLNYDANTDFAGWNLVGNPFPVAAYADRSYYKMNEAGSAIEPVAVSSSTPIEACTGVMVQAETTGETVTFSRTTEQNVGNRGNIQISVAKVPEPVEGPTRSQAGVSTGSTASVVDKAIISFNTGDALEKFVFNEKNAKIFIPQDGKNYAIATANVCRDVARNVFINGDVARYVSTNEMPLNFKAEKNGTYTLSVNVENIELDYLHLIDNMTGADVDLLAASVPELVEGPNVSVAGASTSSATSYTFTAKTSDYASRFRLVFSADAANGDACEPSFAFVSNGEIVITADARGASLQVVDMTGRVIVCRDTSNVSAISTIGMAPGIYVLRLISGDDLRTQKIAID